MGNKVNPTDDLQQLTRIKIIQQFVQARKSRDMTQTEMAKIVEVPRPNIVRFESGTHNPSLAYLVKLADAMNLDLEVKLVERTAVENEQ